jgi:hypothetical protein
MGEGLDFVADERNGPCYKLQIGCDEQTSAGLIGVRTKLCAECWGLHYEGTQE